MNLLSKVTRGPYSTENEWVLDAAGDDVCIMDDESGTPGRRKATHQLLAASYDHALLLAGLMANKISFYRRVDGSVRGMTMAAGTYEGEPDFTYISFDLDPFGCPILTDELRAELERLLGLFSGETAEKVAREQKDAEPQNTQPQS